MAASKLVIRSVNVVNEGQIKPCDVVIEDQFIAAVVPAGSASPHTRELNAEGLFLMPGLIDDQVHFREPGLTHKGTIGSESRAAIAGGITTFFEMPNTQPPAVTRRKLEEKYSIAAESSWANYSFFMGTTNDNLDEVKAIDPTEVCGVKIFMGSSTGNMLVDDERALRDLFRNAPTLIATHCEDEATVRVNNQRYRSQYGPEGYAALHPLIRSEEACYLSSSRAVAMARETGARLHVLHISTARELELFQPGDVKGKQITAEACTHHLWFSDADYEALGNRIKWNPAVKTPADREAIRQAVIEGRIDVIATDHAPHTLDEKNRSYFEAPSGGPLVQHTLQALLELHHRGVFSLELIARKTAHSVADLFQIDRRGYIREGYFADMVLVDLNRPQRIEAKDLLYHCGWSPFEGISFKSRVAHTFINGNHVYNDGKFQGRPPVMRARFNRT